MVVVVVHREWVARENGATPVVARGGSYWLNHEVLAMAVVLSFDAAAMEVVGLIQRWRDQVRREEKRGLRLNLFA